jgi:hypothetical protein
MAQENVVVVRFTEPSKAYQAISVLKERNATVASGWSPRRSSARRPASCTSRERGNVGGRHGERPPVGC